MRQGSTFSFLADQFAICLGFHIGEFLLKGFLADSSLTVSSSRAARSDISCTIRSSFFSTFAISCLC